MPFVHSTTEATMEQVEAVLRHNDGRRWASVTLSLRDPDPSGEYPVRAPKVVCDVEALDELAATYGVRNWESGVVGGVRFGLKHLKVPYRGTVIHAIRGALRSDDMQVLSWAASIAVAEFLHRDSQGISTPGWEASTRHMCPSQNNGGSMTLEELREHLGLSRERVSQIQSEVHKKLSEKQSAD